MAQQSCNEAGPQTASLGRKESPPQVTNIRTHLMTNLVWIITAKAGRKPKALTASLDSFMGPSKMTRNLRDLQHMSDSN